MHKKKPKVGINYRKEIADDILNNLSSLDMIEVNTERLFIEEQDKKLVAILEALPCILHGLSLSLGDEAEIDGNYLSNLENLLKKVRCEWFSEHVATTKVLGLEVRNLLPVPFTEKAALRIAKKINQIVNITDIPFIIENVTYYYPMPGSNMSEIDFINLILSEATCGMLLDLNNLFCNSTNHGYDAHQFIDQLPHNKIVEIHLAGGADIYNMQVDTHATKISKEVYDLFSYCSTRVPFSGVILERDTGGPLIFSEMLTEITIIRNILCESCYEVSR